MSHRTPYHRRLHVTSGVLDVSDAPHAVYDVSLDVRDAHVWDPESAAMGPSFDRCTELDSLVPPAGPDLSRAPKRHRSEANIVMPMLSSGSSSTTDLHPPPPGLSTVKKQRPKQYKRREPSRFCHLCGRRSPNVPMAICSRVIDGMCRKVVCEYCFEKYGWDRSVIDDAKRVRERNGSEMDTVTVRKTIWECPHCEGKCGHKAQCKTYGRTNYKRHLRLRNKRTEQATTSRKPPSNSKKQLNSSKKQEGGSKKQESSSRKQESTKQGSK